MDRLLTTLFLAFSLYPLNSQSLSAEDAISMILRNQSTVGEFDWRHPDVGLKELAISILREDTIPFDEAGYINLISRLTSDFYDPYFDSIFVNEFLVDCDKFNFLTSDRARLLTRHFTRPNYSNSSLEKINAFASKEKFMSWKLLTADYLAFLEVDSIAPTLFWLKEHIDCVDKLNPAMRLSAYSIDLMLARMGLVCDTFLVDGFSNIHDMGERLQNYAKVRTAYSFEKIGEILLAENLPQTWSQNLRNQTSQLALSYFMIYVENFPEKSAKSEDMLARWNAAELSRGWRKKYSTMDEYLDFARQWYIQNKANLILDKNKW